MPRPFTLLTLIAVVVGIPGMWLVFCWFGNINPHATRWILTFATLAGVVSIFYVLLVLDENAKDERKNKARRVLGWAVFVVGFVIPACYFLGAWSVFSPVSGKKASAGSSRGDRTASVNSADQLTQQLRQGLNTDDWAETPRFATYPAHSKLPLTATDFSLLGIPGWSWSMSWQGGYEPAAHYCDAAEQPPYWQTQKAVWAANDKTTFVVIAANTVIAGMPGCDGTISFELIRSPTDEAGRLLTFFANFSSGKLERAVLPANKARRWGNLSPGSYTVYVVPRNPDGSWIEPEKVRITQAGKPQISIVCYSERTGAPLHRWPAVGESIAPLISARGSLDVAFTLKEPASLWIETRRDICPLVTVVLHP